MALGEPSNLVVKDLDQLSRAIFDVQPQNSQELALYQDALRLLAVMTDNRNERLDSSDGSMPRILWFVLIIGGLITLGYPAFFGSTNLLAQVPMTGGAGGARRACHAARPSLRLPLHRGLYIPPDPFDQALRQMPAEIGRRPEPRRRSTFPLSPLYRCLEVRAERLRLAGSKDKSACRSLPWRGVLTETKTLEEALAEAFTRADSLDAPLERRLQLYVAELRKLLPDLEATYHQLVARIQANGADILVPAVGERFPEFLMTDSDGHLVDLASLLSKGPLVISFNRGPWCDYCGLELHVLARAYPEIVAAGAEVVSIMPETAKYARALKQSRGLPFRVLTDLDLAYALSLGLVFWVGDKIKQTYRQFGIDLEQFQGQGGWLLPIPATLVIGTTPRQSPVRRPGFSPSHGNRGHSARARLGLAHA